MDACCTLQFLSAFSHQDSIANQQHCSGSPCEHTVRNRQIGKLRQRQEMKRQLATSATGQTSKQPCARAYGTESSLAPAHGTT